ncbi:ComEA family DNA-binding protein [Streptomyces sp. V4-01]|uniref:ComEA family DNA-binding protein n=1 Tax=Actinacidiphila polyblastidii TaxID=3110430 RepID=A0ABU7PEW4_9ACTN|nr:ComEA family DNA-binding protein [Streptomyces sp. V4-01]
MSTRTRPRPAGPGIGAHVVDPPDKDATRRRAEAIFGVPAFAPPGDPAPDGEPAPQPRLADPLPGLPVFGDGPVGRLRAWLFVRCGLEFKTVVALAVVLVTAGGLAFQHYWAGRPHAVRVLPPVAAAPLRLPPAVRPSAAARVTVDIAGKVARPGLRRLPQGSRVADALSAAGGPLRGTDTTALNLARVLVDGEQILVGVHPAPALAPGPADPSGASPPAGPVSLSSATLAQLDALPGVGPVLAQHILDFRTRHGAFTSLTQLRQIPGIGPRKYATLQPLVQP